MGCSSCGTDGKPSGCKSNGGCSSGGCNKMNTFNWLSTYDSPHLSTDGNQIVEVSFKNGARKEFFNNPSSVGAITGDKVVVQTEGGYNIGLVALSGELVQLQMKKKKVKADAPLKKIMRIATDEDLQRQTVARSREMDTLIRTRHIVSELKIDMKLGDIEYQADNKKATFFYTAEGRVDFRELIKQLAKEFKVKIEMKQIGTRQESAMIGGIGSCGRELCCSTWLTDFDTVSTNAARYQNLSINQTKLSGQCGRLKCCLNYELDTYLDALDHFPKNIDLLRTKDGDAALIKTDVFKNLLFYIYKDPSKHKIFTVEVQDLKKALAKGQVESLESIEKKIEAIAKVEYEDLTGDIELKALSPNKKKRNNPQSKKTNNPTSRSPKVNHHIKKDESKATQPVKKEENKVTPVQKQENQNPNKPKNNRNKNRNKNRNPNNPNSPNNTNPNQPKSQNNDQGANNKRPSNTDGKPNNGNKPTES